MSKKFAIDWSSAKKAMVAQDSKKDYTDKRLYVPEFNKTGTSETVIRFLPSKDTEIPYAKVYNHSFNQNGKWYIENCHTTINAGNKDIKCPACDSNRDLWKSLTKDQQDERKRKLSFYGNILIMKDPLHPENNGKVFLFRYGVKIHEKIMERTSPPEGSIIKAFNIHDWYEGLDFNLIIKKITGKNGKPQNNYDSASFEGTPTAIGEDDVIEKICEKLYSIKEYYNPENFKPYDDCKKRFEAVIGTKQIARASDEENQPPSSGVVDDEKIEDTASVFAQIDDED